MSTTRQAHHEPRHTAQEQLGPVQVWLSRLPEARYLSQIVREAIPHPSSFKSEGFLTYVVVLTEGTCSVLISQGKGGLFYIYKVSDVRRGNIVYAFKSFQSNCPRSTKMKSR